MFYITGDTHADLNRFKNPILKKLKRDDYLIICGDFGFIWDDSKEEQNALKKLSRKKYNIAFVDGTHENFDMLNSYPVEEFCGGKIHRISDNIIHLMRGQIFNIDNKKFFTLGGGESSYFDKEIHSQSNSWYSDELPDEQTIKEAEANLDNVLREVDYIITHEPPPKLLVRIQGNMTNINPFYIYLDKLVNNVTFKQWFFGSTHINRKLTQKFQSVFDSIVPVDMVIPGKRFFKK